MSTMGTPLPAVEALLPYGGDYTLTPTGDIAIITDTPQTPAATIQRITFLILTNPAVRNILNTGTSSPDDICNPDYGSGARAEVGRPNTQSDIDSVTRAIMSALLSDPFVANNPRPQVSIVPNSDSSKLIVNVRFTAVSGQPIEIPDVLQGGG